VALNVNIFFQGFRHVFGLSRIQGVHELAAKTWITKHALTEGHSRAVFGGEEGFFAFFTNGHGTPQKKFDVQVIRAIARHMNDLVIETTIITLFKKTAEDADDMELALAMAVIAGRVSYKLDPDGAPRFFAVTN